MEHLHSHRGFTLIELLVVLAIILVLTAITITSQTSFNKTLVLSNTAYDIALAIRSAENFGLGSRGGGAANVGPNIGYGVHFDSTKQNSFILFADADPSPGSCHPPIGPVSSPGDCVYDATGATNDSVVNTYTLGNGITVNNFCIHAANGFSYCAGPGGFGFPIVKLATLDITFARPNGAATTTVNGQSWIIGWYPVTSTCLTITSPQGGLRYVSVAPSGEITANATSCP